MPTISARMAPRSPNVKGQPRALDTYRGERRNAVRAMIRKAAEAKRSFPGWGNDDPVMLMEAPPFGGMVTCH